MAKKRLVVSPMDTSKSIVQPVARAVETYTRPAEERTQNQLATFMEGITPALKQQAAQQQRQIAERNNAIKSGVIARQAQEARVATYDLLTTAGLEFEKNSEEYLEAGADTLTADRQAFFDGHFQKMEEAGIDSEVIASVKRDVQYGNLKFFQEGFLPAKQTHENNKSLNILSKDLLITANATNLSPEAALAEIQKKTKDFVATHPSITWTQVNDLVRKSEATLASTLGEDGLPRGSTVMSEWLTSEKQTTTKDDLASWATIQNSNARRDVGLKKKAATALDTNIKTSTNLITDVAMATIKGNSELYYKDAEALNAFTTSTIDTAVEEFAKTNNEADTLRYKQALTNQMATKLTKQHMSNIIDTQQAEVVNSVTTNSFNFATPDATIEFLDKAVADKLVDRDTLIKQLLDTQDNRTPEIGAGEDNGVMAWLKKEGALNDAKNSDKVASIVKKNLAFVVAEEKKAFISSVIKQDIDNNVLMNTTESSTIITSDNKSHTFTMKDKTAAFEEMYGSLSPDEKLARWYGPRGIVPAYSKGIVASGSRFFTSAPANTQDMLIAQESINEIQKLVAAGIPLDKVLPSEEARKRYEVVKFYTQDIDKAPMIPLTDAQGNVVLQAADDEMGEGEPVQVKDITSALLAGSSARFDLTVSANELTTAIQSEISEISPTYIDLSETYNPLLVVTDIKKHATMLIQGGIPVQEAVEFATEQYAKDNPIIEDGVGNKTTIRIYNTDVSKVPNAVQNLQDLGAELAQLKEFKDIFESATGGAGEFGIRWKNNKDNSALLDIQIINADGGEIYNLGSVGATDAMNNTAKIKKLAAKRLLEGRFGANASSIRDDVTQEDIDAMLKAQQDLFGS